MAQYKDIIIPSGSKFSNAKITGFGVSFPDAKQNQFDRGIRQAKFGEFDVTAVIDRSKEDTAPFVQSKTLNGFSVKIGTIVNIRLTKNVTNSIPAENIIMTGNAGDTGVGGGVVNNPTSNNTPNTTNPTTAKSIFTTKNIVIGVLAIGAIFGILKITKKI